MISALTHKPSPVSRFGLALLLVAVATFFRWSAPGLLAGTPYLAYYPAIAAAAALGGFGPGLFATFLTALFVDFFFVGTAGQLNCLHDSVEMGRVLVLFGGGVIVSTIAGLLRSTRLSKAQQAETLAVTLASIGDGVIVTETQGRVTFMNAEAERLTGWACADAEGKLLTEVFRIINEQTREPVESPVDKVLRLGTVIGLANHTVLIAKDGREVPIDDSGAPVRRHDGSVHGVVLVFRDFSEQKAAQETLRQSEARRKVAEAVQAERQRFDEVLNMLPAYVALLSTDYHVPFANRFFEERFGKSEGKRCYEYLFGRTEPCENCETYKVLETHAPHRWDWTGPDGRNYDIHDFPFTDVDGTPLIMEVGIDVTERKRAEAALQQVNQTLEHRVVERTVALRNSERRYRSFVEVTNQFAWVTDADGRVEEDVPALRQFTGQTYEQARGTGWAAALHPDDQERTLEVWNRAVASRTQYEIEYRMRRHDGVYRLLLARGVPIIDDSGSVREWVGTCVDITERKQVEVDQALITAILRVLNRDPGDLHQLVREVLRLIRESTGFDAVGLRLRRGDDCPYYEQDGFSDEFLREENSLCEKRGDGSIVRDADGQAVLECTCGLVLGGRTDPSQPFFTEGGSFWTNRSSELLALGPEADPRTNPRNRCIHLGYQSVALVPVRSGGEIIGLLQLNDRRAGQFTPERLRFFEGLADNIGLALKRKQAEEALAAARISAEQAKAAAEEANQAKDRFLAVLSHELRTPLTPVLAAVSMLQKRQAAPSLDYLELIRRNVELEARLIDDLLDLTRIARGKVELDRRPVDLGTVITRAVEVCRPDIEARQLEFGMELGLGPYTIDADAARVQQVFWNLLKNAIKFTPQGGLIEVRCRPDNDDAVVVEVNDSGAGISPQAMPRIFDAFAQANRAVTRQFGGLGLGLAISKSLVELHGGTIEATSAGEGKGSSFKVRLPLLTCMEPAAPAPLPSLEARPATGQPAGLRILVVEDHGDAAEMIRLVLEAEGHQVETADAVATGLQAASEGTFDLLISDLGLPDGSGLDLIRELRANGHRMPAIALSGYGQENDIQQSRAAGFAAHIIKPVDMDRLMAVLSDVASRN